MSNTVTGTVTNISHNNSYGWICPICGRALSPWTTSCPYHGNNYTMPYWYYHYVPYYQKGPTCTATSTKIE